MKWRICKIEGCGRTVASWGLCDAHYWRSRKYGSAMGHLPVEQRARRGEGMSYKTVKVYERVVGEHILIAEKALGHRLPPGAIVHHINSNRRDNRHENLVVCPDEAYHQLLHKHTRMLATRGLTLKDLLGGAP